MSAGRYLQEIAEYNRRLALGENPSPLVQRIDLASIAGEENHRIAMASEKHDPVATTTLRNVQIHFSISSRRLLWQAFGQEYIEPDLLDFIDSVPADGVYMDVGASTGLFALYAAAIGKRVICFEPEVANFSVLNYNTWLNHESHKFPVRNFNVALSEKSGLGEIFIEKFETGGHLKILDKPVKRFDNEFVPDFRQSVLKYSLDDFLDLCQLPPPTHIKIDVDGSEPEVLLGMKRLLADVTLRQIFIELEESGNNHDFCHSLLIGNGFRVESRRRVQNYFGEDNFIFTRD